MTSKGFVRAVVCVLSTVAVISVATAASAAPGDLDPAFGGGDGQVATKFPTGNSNFFAVGVQKDGKIVAGGQVFLSESNTAWALVRYKPGGALDTSFGKGGRVVTDFTAGDDELQDLAVLGNGNIVGAGWAGTMFAVVRYTPDGHLDHSFSGDGKALVNFSSGFDGAYDVAPAPGGKLVVSGQAVVGGFDSFALARLTPSGTLDHTFGGDGRVTTAFGANAYANAIIVHSNGSVIAAGDVDKAPNASAAVAWYRPNGSPATGFGNQGTAIDDVGADIYPGTFVELPSGKLVLAGPVRTGPADFDAGLVRLGSRGKPDESFGPKGLVQQNFGASAVPQQVRLTGTKFVVGMDFGVGSDARLAAARFLANGAVDPGFGQQGLAKATLHASGGEALAIQKDGRIVVAGETSVDANSTAAVARFLAA